MEFIKNVAGLITALTVIVGAVIAVEKWSKGKISDWLLKPFITKLNAVELDTLKIIIVSEEMPIEERLKAGERYLAKGGNGAIKVLVHVLQEKYKESLEGLK